MCMNGSGLKYFYWTGSFSNIPKYLFRASIPQSGHRPNEGCQGPLAAQASITQKLFKNSIETQNLIKFVPIFFHKWNRNRSIHASIWTHCSSQFIIRYRRRLIHVNIFHSLTHSFAMTLLFLRMCGLMWRVTYNNDVEKLFCEN